jgi:hypothetical protein
MLRDGSRTEDVRLDRLPQFDDESRRHRVRLVLDEPRNAAVLASRRRRRPKSGFPLDQGQEGACTWASTANRLNSSPRALRPAMTMDRARELYFEAQKVDEWPGGAYPGAVPQYEGSSVLAAMQVALREGFIASYRWVGAGSQTAVDDLEQTLRELDAVVLGTYWLTSMFEPQPNGLLEVTPDSGIAGGHAWFAVDVWYGKLPGTTRKRLYLVMQNSWGPDWGVTFRGQPGHAYIPFEDGSVEWLLEHDGEGAVPIRPAQRPRTAAVDARERGPAAPRAVDPAQGVRPARVHPGRALGAGVT